MSLRKKTHRKTRTGCITCRQRRVKCDEGHPICQNCYKREIECSWGDPELPVAKRTSSSHALSVECNFISPTGHISREPSYSNLTLDMDSLRLLHHFTTSTLLPPGNDLRNQQIQTKLPPLGFEHSCLMHSILAISALHIAISSPTTTPGVDYLSLGDTHCQQTVHLLNSDISGGNNAEREAAKFMAWIFMSLYTLAGPRKASNSWAPKVLDYMANARRCGQFYHRHGQGFLRTGPLSFLATNTLHRAVAKTQTFLFPAALQDIHLPTSLAPNPEEVTDATVSEIYEDAVKKLKTTFLVDAHSELRIASLFAWSMAVMEGFHEFIEQRRPRALVILAHFCVILQRNTGAWWEADVDDNIRKIAGVLDSSWLQFMNLSFSSFQEEVVY